MRDKQTPGDTYNYKEHVYADPVALRQEIEKDRQEEAEKSKVRKYQKSSSPPPVPSGPRKSGTVSAVYAELAKKSNLPTRPSVRDLGSQFGGTVPRVKTQSGRSQDKDDPLPPPLPAVTESRNILDGPESSPESPIKNAPGGSLPNLLSDVKELNISEDEPRKIVNPEVNAPAQILNVEQKGSEEPPTTSLSEEDALDEIHRAILEAGEDNDSAGEKGEVVIDVRINSEAGIEIGAEIPVAAEEADTNNADSANGGVVLIRSVKRDPFATEDSEKTGDAKPGSSADGKPEQPGSEAGSGSNSSGSMKRKKKKDIESGFRPSRHLRRNLILISLFLLIVLIMVSAAVVVLVNYAGT